MTPLTLIGWSAAIAVSAIIVGFAFSVVRAALRSGASKPTLVTNIAGAPNISNGVLVVPDEVVAGEGVRRQVAH